MATEDPPFCFGLTSIAPNWIRPPFDYTVHCSLNPIVFGMPEKCGTLEVYYCIVLRCVALRCVALRCIALYHCTFDFSYVGKGRLYTWVSMFQQQTYKSYFLLSERGFTLPFGSVTKDDTGVYTCWASNTVGTRHREMVLDVQCKSFFLRRQSLLFDIIPHSVQPSSPSSSPLPSPLVFHYHRPPSYIVLLSSHHMPIPFQPPFLDFLCKFPHFCCPAHSFISYLVQLRNFAHQWTILAFAFLRPPIYFPVPSSMPTFL